MARLSSNPIHKVNVANHPLPTVGQLVLRERRQARLELRGDRGPEGDFWQQMVAAGVSGPLVASDQLIEGGTTTLRLKGEAAFTRADIDGAGTLESTTLNASRQRLMLEGTHDRKLASGATLTPSIEIGMRNDGGDGETGNSIETGGGLRYVDSASGLTIEGRARTLLDHSGDYKEWGVSGLVRLDPGPTGRGLALSVQPAWGQIGSGVQRLWGADVTGGALPANQGAGHMTAEIGYGLGAGRGARPRGGDALYGARARRRRRAVVAHGHALAGSAGREPEP